MTVPRNSHTATLLNDGRVLVAGGAWELSVYAVCELFDPRTGAWTRTGSLLEARVAHRATLLKDGRVLVSSGVSNSGSLLKTSELYDPDTGLWTLSGSLAETRVPPVTVLLSDGSVLAAGGNNIVAETYDPATGLWNATDDMTFYNYNGAGALLPSGDVLVMGSSNPSDPDNQRYLAATRAWTAAPQGVERRSWPVVATSLKDGRVLLISGSGYNSQGASVLVNTSEVYDERFDAWTQSQGTLTTAREYLSATLLESGQVLVAGGVTIGDVVLSSSEVYDPSGGGTWRVGPSMTQKRWLHTATRLPNGHVLVTGGMSAAGNQGGYITLASCEVYVP